MLTTNALAFFMYPLVLRKLFWMLGTGRSPDLEKLEKLLITAAGLRRILTGFPFMPRYGTYNCPCEAPVPHYF